MAGVPFKWVEVKKLEQGQCSPIPMFSRSMPHAREASFPFPVPQAVLVCLLATTAWVAPARAASETSTLPSPPPLTKTRPAEWASFDSLYPPDRPLDLHSWISPSGARILDTSLRCWQAPTRRGTLLDSALLCLKTSAEGTLATIHLDQHNLHRSAFQEWIHVDGNRLNLVPVILDDGRILLREGHGFSCSSTLHGRAEDPTRSPDAWMESNIRRGCQMVGVFHWKESWYVPETPFDTLYPPDRQLDVKSWRSPNQARIPSKESTCWTVPGPGLGLPPAPGILCLFTHGEETRVHLYREEGARLRLVFDRMIRGWTNWLDLYPVADSSKVVLAEVRGYSCSDMLEQLEEKIEAGVPPPGWENLLQACGQREFPWRAGAYRLPDPKGPFLRTKRARGKVDSIPGGHPLAPTQSGTSRRGHPPI